MPDRSLYERLGGYDAIAAVAEDLVSGLQADALLGRFWQGKKIPKAYKITRMGKRIYGDSVQERLDRWGKKYYTIGGNLPGYADTEDSDFEAIARNLISITPLHLDWTNYASLETLLKRKF